MAAKKKNQSTGAQSLASWKPGSDPTGGKKIAGRGDFGVPAGEGSERDRAYTSENTKHSDPGAALPAAWEHDGVRDHGAGVPDSGPGSGSGGDIDTDIIGVASGSTDIGSQPGRKNEVKPVEQPKGSFVSPEDDSSNFVAEGPDAANNPAAQDDDSFAGEVSRGEGRGEDNSLSGR